MPDHADAGYIAFAVATFAWWLTSDNRPYYIKEASMLGLIKTWRQEALDRHIAKIRDETRQKTIAELRADPAAARTLLGYDPAQPPAGAPTNPAAGADNPAADANGGDAP